jgi:hypothetical protein
MIWKNRNGCIFNQAQPSAGTLVGRIKEEAAQWVKAAGATGLGVFALFHKLTS